MRSHTGRPQSFFISISLSSFPESSLPCQPQDADYDALKEKARNPAVGPSWILCSHRVLQVVPGPLPLLTAHDGMRTPVVLKMSRSRLGCVRASGAGGLAKNAVFKPRNSDTVICGKEPWDLQKGLSSPRYYEAQPNLKSANLRKILLRSNYTEFC